MQDEEFIYPPPKLLPYFEKFRIYELFQSLATELVIAMPKDHLLFLKTTLSKMIKNGRDHKKIILLISPNVQLDHSILLQNISMNLGTSILTRSQILESYRKTFGKQYVQDFDNLAILVAEKLKSPHFTKHGWILYGYPDSALEAFPSQKAAVLPTSTLHLYTSKDNGRSPEQCSGMEELSRAYKATVKKINMEGVTMEQAVEICLDASKKRPINGMPTIYRVVVLGPCGFSRHMHTTAIADTFNLIQINFQYLYRQAALGNDEIAKKIKNCKCEYTNLIEILQRKIYQKDCLQQGWIMTHFPRNVKDFEVLDGLYTPPNRVIFLEVPEEICKNRIIQHSLKGQFQYSEAATRAKLKESEAIYANEAILKIYCRETWCSVDITKPVESIQVALQKAIMTVPETDLIRGRPVVDTVENTTLDYLTDTLRLFY